MIKLDFQLKDKIRIIPINRNGRIIAILINDLGIQYMIRYFDNAEAKTVYFYKDELDINLLPE